MKSNEKLQQPRTGKNLTWGQLAEQLYVSRAVISKQESSGGYPNIESLKCISKFFSMAADELLSGEELITLAETENRSSLKEICNYIYGILGMMAVAFVLPPSRGSFVGGYAYAVSLPSLTAATPFDLMVYWSAFTALIVIGITRIILTHLDKETWGGITIRRSLGLIVLAICFLTAAREPYITTLIFLLFIIEITVWIRRDGTK